MKRMLICKGLLALLMFLTAGATFAGSGVQSELFPKGEMALQDKTWSVAIDLGDLSAECALELETDIEKILDTYLSAVDPELNCKVSVTGKVNVGVASVNITVEVSGPGSKVKSQGKAIARQVLSDIQSALK